MPASNVHFSTFSDYLLQKITATKDKVLSIVFFTLMKAMAESRFVSTEFMLTATS